MKKLIALGLALIAAFAFAQEVATTNPLGGSDIMVDRLIMFDSAEDFESGSLGNARIVGDAVVLGGDASQLGHLVKLTARAYPTRGSWTSPVIETEFGVTDVLPSWNIDTPEGCGGRLTVRTRDAESGEWSPWLSIGHWGTVNFPPERTIRFEHGVVNVDILNLDRPADAVQVRASLSSRDRGEGLVPWLRRVAVCYSGDVTDSDARAALMDQPEIMGEWARTLDVPHTSQGILGAPLSGQCCSPTSCSMMFWSLGSDATVLENSLAIYDEEYGIFGNWGRAVARAGELGFDAWLTRFRNWDQVKAMIAQGQPVVASVSINEGDITGLTYTGGHLVVIRGFTPDGDIIINDPAYRERGEASVWAADEMATVWFGHGGVGYIIRPQQ